MSVILLLIPLSVLFAGGFLAVFFWAVRSGQYEDTCTPSMRMLADDPCADGPQSRWTQGQGGLSGGNAPTEDVPRAARAASDGASRAGNGR